MKKNLIRYFIKYCPRFIKKLVRLIIRWIEDKRFEYKIDTIPGEMKRGELNWLFKTARKMDSIVEIGSYKGRSTHALLSGCRGIVWAVDNFVGMLRDRENPSIISNEIYQEFLKNVGHFKNLIVLKMDSLTAVKKFKDKSVDMVFIDADHSYEAVKSDIEAWLPKCKKLICGHDYNGDCPGVKRAVDEKFGLKVGKIYNIWFYYLEDIK